MSAHAATGRRTDNENIPLPGPVDNFDEDPTARLASPPYREAVGTYEAAEVLPYVPDAWVDHAATRIGYKVRALEEETHRLLREVAS